MPENFRLEDAPKGTWRRLLLALAAAAIVFAPVTSMAEIPIKPGTPNIWGVWLGVEGPGLPANAPYKNVEWTTAPDFTPWGAAEAKRLASADTPGECDPWGPTGYSIAKALFPLDIMPTTTGIVMIYEGTTFPRRIYTDGRPHPADLDPTWLGHAIGHWEGDTLVIDTIGTNGRTRPINGYISGAVMDGVETDVPRLPASDQMHLIERYRLVGGGEYLEAEVTVIDPKTYKHPITSKRYQQRRPDIDLQEYVCNDNNRPDVEGQARAHKPKGGAK